MIPLEYYLIISAVMLFAGIYGFLTRRNTLAMLISIELMGTSLPCSPSPSRLRKQPLPSPS